MLMLGMLFGFAEWQLSGLTNKVNTLEAVSYLLLDLSTEDFTLFLISNPARDRKRLRNAS